MSPAPYRERLMAPMGRLDVPGHALKRSVIHLVDRPAPDAAVMTKADEVARAVLPPAGEEEGGSEGLGFAILHEGLQGTWLLLHWWAHGDILCGRLLRAEPGGADFAPQDRRPLVACVWELAVIDHERHAWVRAMMRETPDPAAYLADALPPGPR